MEDARRYGFATRQAYARARRAELTNALQIAGIDPRQAIALEFVDQECVWHLAELALRIRCLITDEQPRMLLAPSYEGGHPDHDSVAFAVHAACRMIRKDLQPPAIFEYALYHNCSGKFCTGEFLPFPNCECFSVSLNESAKILKRRMLNSFTTQREILAPFSTSSETFRTAPQYDFTRPPHQGKLYYENFPWGVSGAEWRARAAAAARELGITF